MLALAVFVSSNMVACNCIWAIGLDSPVRLDDAFAAIAAETVKGGYHQYPPFYNNVISPHAVVTRDAVYCAFQNTNGQPIMMAYDIGKRRWSEPVRASQFGLGRDAHGNPSICIDSTGYIHIFYGCHGQAMRHTRSNKSYNITSWQEQSVPTPRATYPQSMRMANNDIYLFYRAGGHMEPWCLRTSKDDGQTWSEPEKIIEMRLEPNDPLAAAYCSFHPGSDSKTVHCFWVHKDDNARRVKGDRKHPWRPLKYPGLHEAVYRYNMYYIYRDTEGIWRNIAGDKVKLPVSKAFADKKCLVFDSGDEFTNIGFPTVDSNNCPYVRFPYGVGDWKKGDRIIVPWRHKFAHYDYDLSKWQVTDEVPQDWPLNVKTILTAKGPAAPLLSCESKKGGDKSQGRWFIFFSTLRSSATAEDGQHARPSEEAGSFIFLYHERGTPFCNTSQNGNPTGYAIREGGPVFVQ